MRIFCLSLVVMVVVGCAKSNEHREYNPWITVVRITTGNMK